MEVTAAETSAAALALLNANDEARFDLGIVDDQMPGMDGIQLAKLIRQDSRWSALRLILLSSRDDHDSSESSKWFAATLTKPLRRSQLFACIARVMAMQPVAMGAPPAASPAAAAAAVVRAAGPKILLVEDNPVNREVAVGMLESLGCVTDAAENGRLAIEAMTTAAYDAVLMDCQMPVMDGLTATGEIRRREQGSGAARCPSSP